VLTGPMLAAGNLIHPDENVVCGVAHRSSKFMHVKCQILNHTKSGCCIYMLAQQVSLLL
jgi:hypothetical protein